MSIAKDKTDTQYDPALEKLWKDEDGEPYSKTIKIQPVNTDLTYWGEPRDLQDRKYYGNREIHWYEPNGLCPLHIRDLITSKGGDGRKYAVCGKIAASKDATVLAAKRMDDAGREVEDWKTVVVKVRGSKRACRNEMDVIHKLMELEKNDTSCFDEDGLLIPASVESGRAFVDVPFELFETESPNGTHIASVGEWYVMDFRDEQDIDNFWTYASDYYDTSGDWDWHKSAAYGLRFAAQIARGVAYLHDNGIVHGCIDWKHVMLRNIMDPKWPETFMETYDLYPTIFATDVMRVDGASLEATVPRYTIHRSEFDDLKAAYGRIIRAEDEDIPRSEVHPIVRLVGLGSSHFESHQTDSEWEASPHTQAPEVASGGMPNSSKAADVWSLGCTIIFLLLQYSLVDRLRWDGKGADVTDEIIDEMFETSIKGQLHSELSSDKWGPALEGAGIEKLASLLRSMVRVRSEDRISARGAAGGLTEIVEGVLGEGSVGLYVYQ